MALVIGDLRRRFGPILALDGVSLRIERSQIVCLVGPSGCGKTTLLRMVAGLDDEVNGTIALDGRALAHHAGDIGFVFQQDALFPWLTVTGNVAFGLRARGKSEAESRRTAAKYVEMVGLAEFASSYPKHLSGGMKQRAALARALAYGPSLLLLDEPFAALDAQSRNVMQSELLRLWAIEQKTILFVTHSMDEAIYLADRVVVMTARPGRIKADIPVGLPRPRNRTDIEFNRIRSVLLEMIAEEVDKTL